MAALLNRRAFLGLLVNVPAALACAPQEQDPLPTAPPLPPGLAGVTATPVPSPTATPLPTPTSTPTPVAVAEMRPAQAPQGGSATAILNERAQAATVTFQGRPYPMLQSGGRWWCVVGTGALTTPGVHPVAFSYTPAAGPAVAAAAGMTVLKKDFPVEYIQLDPNTAALLAPEVVRAELDLRASVYEGYTPVKLWSGAFRRPSSGPMSGVYGEGRSYNRGPVTDYHRGTDFAGEIGSPVYSAAAGRAAFVGELRIRGGSVIIDHGAGVFTAYHHLSRRDVAQGQPVVAGQLVGAMGATGLVTGPHLHWEVVVRGVEVDGEEWLTDREFGL